MPCFEGVAFQPSVCLNLSLPISPKLHRRLHSLPGVDMTHVKPEALLKAQLEFMVEGGGRRILGRDTVVMLLSRRVVVATGVVVRRDPDDILFEGEEEGPDGSKTLFLEVGVRFEGASLQRVSFLIFFLTYFLIIYFLNYGKVNELV